jgi:hypothetical protein
MTIHVFVGYDVREHAAWLVCRDTILNPVCGEPLTGVEVHPVSHRDLRRRGLFSRPWRIDESGQTWDVRDGRPFSTEFSHSRFLVPHMARQLGVRSGPVVFVDCDFMFLSPITQMLDGINRSKLVSVVKHDFASVKEGLKMDGMAQQRYFRKLWSSLMVFNMGHEEIEAFHPAQADHGAGATLHGFLHLDDHEIGEIEPSWNFIPDHSYDTGAVDAIHWSFGGPWMNEFARAPYASVWRERYREVLQHAIDDQLSETFPLL